jgi:hypothetical protein
MSAAAAAPPATQPAADNVQAVVTAPTGFGVVASTAMLIPLLILFLFHLGAAYLSYQKYGSLGWAFFNFIFAYFYYPYYSFFLAKEPAPSALPAMMGGMKGFSRMLKKWTM